MRARTAVIPAAGLGTRFYPVTKAVPKELLPIYDVPALQLVMDEAIGAGADHIVLVSSRVKTPIEKFVTPDPAVVEKVRASGREDLANRLARIDTDVKVTITYQDNPHGLGHAVGCARDVVGDEPFMLLLPDELRSGPELLSALADSVQSRGVSAIELLRVPMDKVSAYGVITHVPGAPADGPFDIVGIVEKPKREDAPSDLIIAGRYVCTADIFDKIDRIKPAPNGELQLTDALELQSADSPITGIISTVTRWDTGTPMGWLEAVIDAALSNGDAAAARALLADRLAR
jgi:UTP--glucose-1-phosphate uridylyltransferase